MLYQLFNKYQVRTQDIAVATVRVHLPFLLAAEANADGTVATAITWYIVKNLREIHRAPKCAMDHLKLK